VIPGTAEVHWVIWPHAEVLRIRILIQQIQTLRLDFKRWFIIILTNATMGALLECIRILLNVVFWAQMLKVQ